MPASLAFERLIELLGDAVGHRNGSQAEARCPAHDDRRASLSIGVGTEGDPSAVLVCQAGCAVEDVLAAIGLDKAALFDQSVRSAGTGSSSDPAADLSLRQRGRQRSCSRSAWFAHPERFLQRLPGRGPDWKGGIGDVRRVLYRLPQVMEADRLPVVGSRSWRARRTVPCA